MVDSKEIINLVEALRVERDEALKANNELNVKIWKLEEELRKQKEETERWKTRS